MRGLTPSRALRSTVENLPKPVKVTASPDLSASVTESRNASTAFAASRCERPAFCATRSTNSCFVTCPSSCRYRQTWRKTLPPAPAFVSTMRVCGPSPGVHDLGSSEQRPEPDGMPRELVGPALLPVHDAHGRSHPQAGLAERRDRLQRGPA